MVWTERENVFASRLARAALEVENGDDEDKLDDDAMVLTAVLWL
jgi:hypothetical protein